MSRFRDIILKLGINDPVLIKGKSRKYPVDKDSSAYLSAKEFAREYGGKFCEYVLSDIDPDNKTNLAIMLGGAEHLGNLLEIYIEQNRVQNVQAKYLWFTTSVIGLDHQVDEDTGESSIAWSKKFGNSNKELTDYLDSIELFDCDDLVGIDTGVYGHTIFKLAQIVNNLPDPPSLKGRLFNRNGYKTPLAIDGLDITGFNESKNSPKLRSYGYMDLVMLIENEFPGSYSIDSRGIKLHKIEVQRIMENRGTFQKSRMSPSKLHSVGRLFHPNERIWVTDTSPYSSKEDFQAYTSVIAGLSDGLKEADS